MQLTVTGTTFYVITVNTGAPGYEGLGVTLSVQQNDQMADADALAESIRQLLAESLNGEVATSSITRSDAIDTAVYP